MRKTQWCFCNVMQCRVRVIMMISHEQLEFIRQFKPGVYCNYSLEQLDKLKYFEQRILILNIEHH